MSSAEALKELLYKMADDELIIGHRHSEWIGMGPVLEEDIAFGSLAQDKVGHAYNFYNLLHELGEADPDTIGFTRSEEQYKCCHLVEHPNGEYDFSLMRHFLFDHAEFIRFEMLSESSNESLANLAKKYKSEIKYHLFHADTWISQLSGKGSEESKARMQSALNLAYPIALGIFEPGPNEETLISEKIFAGEAALQQKWVETIRPILEKAGLTIPTVENLKEGYGGRYGFHTEAFAPLLAEMTEVVRLEQPGTEW
jgi:ring-1,2-phenylacetyl-CoA epoxidase subunit PaaC